MTSTSGKATFAATPEVTMVRRWTTLLRLGFLLFALGSLPARPAFATVSTTSSRADFTGNGSTRAFAFTFPALSSTDVQVLLGGVVQGSGYTVALNANQSTSPGGTVTFTTAPASSAAVRIQRVSPRTQGTAFSAYTSFPSKTVESTLDRVVMQSQEADRRVADAEATHASDKAAAAAQRSSDLANQVSRDAGQDAVHEADKAAWAAAATSAYTSATNAAASATSAATSAATATSEAEVALFAAQASGNIIFYDSYADADAEAGSLSNGQTIEVLSDETKGGRRTLYRKDAGVLTFKVFLDAIADRLNIYVDSVGGADTNDGTSPLAPKRTLTAALAVIADGGNLWLKSDSRWREFPPAVTRIVHVMKYGGGKLPTIDGSVAVSNAGFATVPGYANVYKITLSFLALDGQASTSEGNSMLQLFEGTPGADARFICSNGFFDGNFGWQNSGRDYSASLAFVRDTPGSFFAATAGNTPVTFPLANATDTLVWYVHLPDNGDPRSNGKEYSVSSMKGEQWNQRVGGSMDDVWFTRAGYAHVAYLEGMRVARLRFDQFHRHGPFFNGVYAEDCEGYGVYGAGAVFHAYRATSADGMGGGNTYVRCKAVNGYWGFYSHGSGGAEPHPQRWAILTDCVIYNVVSPIEIDTRDGAKVTRLRAYDVVSAVGGMNAAYEDCRWIIKETGATTGDPSSNGVFFFAAEVTLRNSYVGGGSVDLGAANGFAARYLWHDCANNVTLINTTIATAATAALGSTGKVILQNSIWPGADATILSSTGKNFLPAVTLAAGGVHPTNGAILGAFSPKRKVALSLPTENVTWEGQGVDYQYIDLVAGSPVITLRRTIGGDIWGPDVNYPWRLADGGFAWNAVPVSMGNIGTPTVTITMDRNAPETRTITVSGTDTVHYRKATIRGLQQAATSMVAYPDDSGAIVTLTGNADDVKQVVPGTLVRLFYDTAEARRSLGVYEVTAAAGGRVTFDRAPPWKAFFNGSYQWRGTDAQVNPTNFVRGLKLAVVFPLAAIDVYSTSLVDPGGATWTGNESGRLVKGSVFTGAKLEDGEPGRGFIVTLPASLAYDGTSPWAFTANLYLPDLDMQWDVAGDGILRISKSSPYYGLGIGCSL